MSIDDHSGPTASRAGADVSRVERKRAVELDRMLATCGFVRSHEVLIDDHGTVSGEVTAPARLIRQSLRPVLDARDIVASLPERAAERSPEAVVTAQLTDTRGGR